MSKSRSRQSFRTESLQAELGVNRKLSRRRDLQPRPPAPEVRYRNSEYWFGSMGGVVLRLVSRRPQDNLLKLLRTQKTLVGPPGFEPGTNGL